MSDSYGPDFDRQGRLQCKHFQVTDQAHKASSARRLRPARVLRPLSLTHGPHPSLALAPELQLA
ncbi:MAG: hypothetical protein EBX17_08355 [Betaproteobacteria bacterium]|nr:hypothetical protein [Betaproteobacteria bacterium]